MKRQDVVRRIARESGLEQKAVETVLQLFLDELEAALVAGRPFQLRPLGTLKPVRRRAKVGRNPFINEPVAVAEHTTAVFRPSPRFKRRLNQ